MNVIYRRRISAVCAPVNSTFNSQRDVMDACASFTRLIYYFGVGLLIDKLTPRYYASDVASSVPSARCFLFISFALSGSSST